MFDTKTRVLVVEDMPSVRKLIVKLCKELGFLDISEAQEGALGWQAITDASPAFGLILSDAVMPVCSGLDLLKRIRGDSRYLKLPFILITTEAEQEPLAEAMRIGANCCMTKPFTTEILRQKLEQAHSRHKGQVQK